MPRRHGFIYLNLREGRAADLHTQMVIETARQLFLGPPEVVTEYFLSPLSSNHFTVEKAVP